MIRVLPLGVTRDQHREQVAARVRRLRAEGLSFAGLASRLGLAATTVSRLARLPAAEGAR